MAFEALGLMLQRRSSERLPDGVWCATVQRVRSEFEEMPCLRVTRDQAQTLFGLGGTICDWVLGKLVNDGFLALTSSGEYVRNNSAP
jgi:hypothetical protein